VHHIGIFAMSVSIERVGRGGVCPDCDGPIAKPGAARCWDCHVRACNRAAAARALSPEADARLVRIPCAWIDCPLRNDPERSVTKAPAWRIGRAQQESGADWRLYHSPRFDGPNAPGCGREASKAAAALRRNRRTIVCKTCEREKEVPRSHTGRGRSQFCSRECAQRGRSRAVTARCEACGRTDTRQPSEWVQLRSFDAHAGTSICRDHPLDWSKEAVERRRRPQVDLSCRICGKVMRVMEARTKWIKSFDRDSLTYRCHSHPAGPAEHPCRLEGCYIRATVPFMEREARKFCSKAHSLAWLTSRWVTHKFECGHVRRVPCAVAESQKYCGQACYFANQKPAPPIGAGARAKHNRAVEAYGRAIAGGARSLREIAAAAHLSVTTVVKLRKELATVGAL
jgi:hypothetical protein